LNKPVLKMPFRLKKFRLAIATISTEDARYSFIRYFASDIQNAYGPNVHDPRSGEIIESHIGWYHNVMSLLNSWYTIQTAAVDPRSRKRTFDDDLMGELIRFVSAHEVGHTLGLRHNFGSSFSSTPVEKLRDKEYIRLNTVIHLLLWTMPVLITWHNRKMVLQICFRVWVHTIVGLFSGVINLSSIQSL
jgi:hypothetical protein